MFITRKALYLTLIPVLAALAGCDDSGSSSNETPTPPVAVGGGGVKGPLAGAVVNLYQVDLAQTNLQGTLIDSGDTGPNAGIQNLEVPADASGLVLLEFVVDADTVDLTTGVAPIFSSLITVVDVQRLLDGGQVYASPLTTMAVNLARRKADSGSPYSGDANGTISATEFIAALAIAQNQVKSTLGFGMSSSTDIFTTPPLITNATTDAASQTAVAAYRQAIEAVAAVAAAVSTSGGGANAQEAFDALTEDLSDGVIDGQSDSGAVEALTPVAATLVATVTQDVGTLVIPGTDIMVGNIEAVLVGEKEDTGATADTTDLGNGGISVDPTPAVVAADADDDGVADVEDAFPDDADNWADADGDGLGDQTDDAFPEDVDNWTDEDADGFGDQTDDAFPDDDTEWVDADGDGFGDNEDDLFPNNPDLQMDQDEDGVDDSVDNCVTIANANQTDTDGDGAGDACDAPAQQETPTLIWDDQSTTWDNANWGQ